MSTNIKQIRILSKSDDFRITLAKLDELDIEDAPEDNPFDDTRWATARDGYLYPDRLPWGGEGSNHTFETFTEDFLPAFEGSADIMVVWESDEIQGYRLRDGSVTEHEVIMMLGEEV